MVLLKSLECSQCHDRCYPYYVAAEAKRVLAKGCTYCARIVCGNCVQTGIPMRGQCSKRRRPDRFYRDDDDVFLPQFSCSLKELAPYYPAMAYIDKFAPADEMRLLSLQRWSPLYCRICSSTKKVDPVGYLFCPYCSYASCSKKLMQVGNSAETKIIGELNELLLDDGRRANHGPILFFRDNEPTNRAIYFQCQVCEQCGNPVKRMDLIDSGRLTCMFCRGNSPRYNVGDMDCLFYLNAFLQYAPDLSDLKELSYSKWTPLKCENCSIAFSEVEGTIPMLDKKQLKVKCQKCTGCISENGQNFIIFYFLVDVIKEFRRYFKTSGIGFEERTPKKNIQCAPQAATSAENYHVERLLVSSLITKTRTTVPETPRCQCGLYEDITKMKDCVTCSVNAICLQCLVKDHWAHQITDTMPELIVEVVNHESAKIQRKLGNWRVRLEQTNSKGKETFGNLVTAYEKLFLKALKSKEPSELHNLISLGDFSELDDLLMETMTTNYRV